ncbi:hypothetical protein EVAR_366_1 [Eumeta japonica]|uniref:Uncharacterized protein n=1 Tax=Eumeta variegata TaxID=151549 RepID=A0A4C1S9S3_EUMVA|nr:hypothetical protein EVAR_366_1 [Eumeta japonica]
MDTDWIAESYGSARNAILFTVNYADGAAPASALWGGPLCGRWRRQGCALDDVREESKNTLLKHKPKRNCCDTKRRHSLGFLTEYRDSGEGIILLYCTCSCQRHKSE